MEWNPELSWPYLQQRHWFLIRVNDYDLSNFFLGTVLLCQKKWCARLAGRVKISNPSLLKCLGHIIFKKQKKWHPLCCVSHPKTIKNYINPLDRFPWLDRCPIAIGPLEGSSHKKALERRKNGVQLYSMVIWLTQRAEMLIYRVKYRVKFQNLHKIVIHQQK